jgi:MFS family permease
MIRNSLKPTIQDLHAFLILWITQSLSEFGSAMTSFALVIWSYQRQGSALGTSLLAVCSYAPYVILSIFAGTLSDRWNKKLIMLASDSFAALCSLAVLALVSTGKLQIWQLYVINGLNGLMNTVQQPASDVAISILAPPRHYQKVSGMRSFSNSLITILTPACATALLSFSSIEVVILFDLLTFLVAFIALLFFIEIPRSTVAAHTGEESMARSAGSGLRYLKSNRGILDLMLLLAAINFTASIFNAALPAMLLSRAGGGKLALGMVTTVTGIATLLGSVLATVLPPPKSRVRTILDSLLFSMSTENFILAFGRSTPLWCLGAILGWIFIPLMNANMDVIFRTKIPIDMQGRVYSARNTLQFFTIPLGYLCGGFLVDRVFEPFMAVQASASVWVRLFGEGKGAGAALLFFVIGIGGSLSCLPFRADRHIMGLEGKS